MLDLVEQETKRIGSRIVKRKLVVVGNCYCKSQLDFERYAVLTVSSIYPHGPKPDVQSQTEGYAIFIPLRPPPGERPQAGALTVLSDCAGFAPN